MTLRIYLMRHGETEWSLSGKHTGRVDIPLTDNGEQEASRLGQRLATTKFDHVLVSPLRRARQTCELAGCDEHAEIEPHLVEWANGDYEGRTHADVFKQRPGWNLFVDGCPNGESPDDISARADELIERLISLDGNVALFSHSHFGRVLGVRWIGLPVQAGQHFILDTASISVLCFQHAREDEYGRDPAIESWNG
ncbi:histidine phosphatase family protein [Rubripirellula amarantea]|uniref:Alpha-ribazole phosphatase n=1 Tax=Rubripirellula amarantea TaxID=2527999 RepID=A0A5C5WVU3_9BACT|nr:histidine phosphatase family protein [Rubripirellula amarantea]MDA8745677.1 histidine phosphatase family protein [Rubripirellula amarantea]TWT54806.1 Alpha-ribazole phosphatase [Rubripirellula amarantea]